MVKTMQGLSSTCGWDPSARGGLVESPWLEGAGFGWRDVLRGSTDGWMDSGMLGLSVAGL